MYYCRLLAYPFLFIVLTSYLAVIYRKKIKAVKCCILLYFIVISRIPTESQTKNSLSSSYNQSNCFSFCLSQTSLSASQALLWAQRKIPVDLHFFVRWRHKASGAALGLSCAACFEQPAGVFAGCGAVRQAKIFASLKIKNGISFTPLNCALKAFTFALKDSADAFVERLSK